MYLCSPPRETRDFLARMLHRVLDHGRLRVAFDYMPVHSVVLFYQMDCQNRCVGTFWTVDDAC